MITFHVEKICGTARAGLLRTPHGDVPTPAFMPVGTLGTVKALMPDELSRAGVRLLIANTYHLWLRPGMEVVEAHGGLHGLMRWPHAIATDSGGYQAFSMADLRTLSDDGFEFASHIDGSRRFLSPETAMHVQGSLGSDIALQLDVCPPAGASREELVSAITRTTKWAVRCLESRREGQALFGIVQGGLDVELRKAHAAELSALPLDGIALGGFSVGEPPEQMHRTLRVVAPVLPEGRPRYLMGVGTPLDLVLGIESGVDLFDCVLPTRNARNGQAFVRDGRIVIKQARYKNDLSVLEPGCICPACAGGYTRSYLRHLYMSGEILAHRLLSLHNVQHYQDLVREARAAVIEENLSEWAEARKARLGRPNQEAKEAEEAEQAEEPEKEHEPGPAG